MKYNGLIHETTKENESQGNFIYYFRFMIYFKGAKNTSTSKSKEFLKMKQNTQMRLHEAPQKRKKKVRNKPQTFTSMKLCTRIMDARTK